ncbi:MAG: hypothetical protein H0U75_12545 [Legionella sp.]|nr:hypothetical protein [Legionella sp.]
MPLTTIFQTVKSSKQTRQVIGSTYEDLLETQGVGGIILTYAFDYFDELTQFCETLGFTQFLKEIHTR